MNSTSTAFDTPADHGLYGIASLPTPPRSLCQSCRTLPLSLPITHFSDISLTAQVPAPTSITLILYITPAPSFPTTPQRHNTPATQSTNSNTSRLHAFFCHCHSTTILTFTPSAITQHSRVPPCLGEHLHLSRLYQHCFNTVPSHLHATVAHSHYTLSSTHVSTARRLRFYRTGKNSTGQSLSIDLYPQGTLSNQTIPSHNHLPSLPLLPLNVESYKSTHSYAYIPLFLNGNSFKFNEALQLVST